MLGTLKEMCCFYAILIEGTAPLIKWWNGIYDNNLSVVLHRYQSIGHGYPHI